MIHKFYLNGLYIVLDVNSGTLLTVDEMTYDVLDRYRKENKETIIQGLKEKYPEDALAEVLDELDALVAQKMLYTENDYDPEIYKNHDLIKALCLHVTHDCNLKCNYCFASQGDFNGEKCLMSLEVGKKAIDFIVEASKDRVNLEVDFFGGEPLMNLEVVKDLVDYARGLEEAHHKHFNFTMTTNGVLLNDDNRQWLDDNMDNIVLSLDGRKEVNDRMRRTVNDKGSYELIVDDIKKMAAMREGKKDYYVRGTYTKYNLDFAKDVDFLAREGFGSISVEPVVTDETKPYALLEEDLPAILAEYDQLALDYLDREKQGLHYNFFHFNVELDGGPCVYKRLSGCGAGRDYVAVTPEGDLYPCHQFVGNTAFKMGSVDMGITNPHIKEEFAKANLLEKDDCSQCWCRFICGGGCHANAYNFNHTVMKPYHVACEIERRRVENALMIGIIEGK